MPKLAFPFAVAVLAGPAILFAPPSAAQGPTSRAWTDCELRESLAEGGQLTFRSSAQPGGAARPNVTWSSSQASPIQLRLLYVGGVLPTGVPARGQATYALESEPQPAEYKLVFDFNGAGQQATLALGPGAGKSLVGNFGPHNADLLDGFARARRVTAIVYEGDRQIAQSTFELAPDRREAGLDAFTSRVQGSDPSLCRSGPPLPVPPVPFPRLR